MRPSGERGMLLAALGISYNPAGLMRLADHGRLRGRRRASMLKRDEIGLNRHRALGL
jgi:hypothetical protein